MDKMLDYTVSTLNTITGYGYTAVWLWLLPCRIVSDCMAWWFSSIIVC